MFPADGTTVVALAGQGDSPIILLFIPIAVIGVLILMNFLGWWLVRKHPSTRIAR